MMEHYKRYIPKPTNTDELKTVLLTNDNMEWFATGVHW